MTRRDSYARKYGPKWGPFILSSKAGVGAAGRTGDLAKIKRARERHARLMAHVREIMGHKLTGKEGRHSCRPPQSLWADLPS